jgi:hypothetical protein
MGEKGGRRVSFVRTSNTQPTKLQNGKRNTFWEESKNFFLEMMISPISV